MLRHNIDHLPHSSEEKKKIPLVPALTIGGAFFSGAGFMMFLNRAECGLILSQFAALWPIEQNRQEILRMCFRIVFTGVIFAALGLACYLVAYGTKQYRQNEAGKSQDVATLQMAGQLLPPLAPVTARHATVQEGMQEENHAPIPPVFRQRPAVSPPFTPIPATTMTWERPALAQQKADQLPVIPIPETMVIPESFIRATTPKPRQLDEREAIPSQALGDTIPVSEERVHHEVAQKVNDRTPSPALPQHAEDEVDEKGALVYITITLLKTITMTLHVPGSKKTYPVTLDDLNGKALQLIAYIARHLGRKVSLGDMRNDVFGSDEMDTNQVQEALNTAKREIRKRMNQAVERATSDMGKEVFPPNLDIFELAKKKYWLPRHCLVTDLTVIEEQHRIIDLAESTNQLVNSVPEYVYAACNALIKAYTGDFLEDLLVGDPYSFDPSTDSWARGPFTQFRDYYLQATLYTAEYERKRGDASTVPAEQREHYAKAGRLFALGATAACNEKVFDGMFDMKVSFSSAPGRRHGPHVLLSEQLIRRATALYGKIGATILVRRAYSTYEQQMLLVSNNVWTADPETLRDLEAAMEQTGAYRFPDTIASPYDLSSNLVKAESA